MGPDDWLKTLQPCWLQSAVDSSAIGLVILPVKLEWRASDPPRVSRNNGTDVRDELVVVRRDLLDVLVPIPLSVSQEYI